MKVLASVLLSVALSVTSVLEIGRFTRWHQEQVNLHTFQVLKAPVWRLDMNFGTPKGVETVGFCSAVAIEPNVLLTAAHCDVAADEQFAFFGPADATFSVNGLKYSIVKKDVEKDLMLLYVPGLNSYPAKLATKAPDEGSEVVAVGYPLGLVEFVTEGHMQSETHVPHFVEENMKHALPKYIATDAPIAGGNSGGGLFYKGQLVGIASLGGGDVGLFVHLDVIKEFLSL